MECEDTLYLLFNSFADKKERKNHGIKRNPQTVAINLKVSGILKHFFPYGAG